MIGEDWGNITGQAGTLRERHTLAFESNGLYITHACCKSLAFLGLYTRILFTMSCRS